LERAEISQEICSACGLCAKYCRFGAIRTIGSVYTVDSFACEGCGVCQAVCPSEAVMLRPAVTGELRLYRGKAVFSTATLQMGSGATGKLVTEVKKRLTNGSHADLAIIDGSPGIGCPVIASMSGADLVLAVTEPTVSGANDLQRLLKTAGIFGVQTAVCVNKYDVFPAMAEKIEKTCQASGIPFVGRIPFDPEAVRAVNQGRTVVDSDCASGHAVRQIFVRTMDLLAAHGRKVEA